MQFSLLIINAFTNKPSHGNPAALLFSEQKLADIQMQKIAQKVGLSETAFVHYQEDKFRVHFYTPTKRIENCGHATIASFGYLKNKLNIKTNKINIINDLGLFTVFFKGSYTFLENKNFHFSSLEKSDLKIIDDYLGFASQAVIAGFGVNFLLIDMQNAANLSNFSIPREIIYQISEKYRLIGFYPYFFDSQVDYYFSRMLAPYYGIEEESATGMAAIALYAYLKQKKFIQTNQLVIKQGHYMNPIRQSNIHCYQKADSFFVGGQHQLNQIKEIFLEK